MKTPTEWRTEWRARCDVLTEEAEKNGLSHPSMDIWILHFEKLIADIQAEVIDTVLLPHKPVPNEP